MSSSDVESAQDFGKEVRYLVITPMMTPMTQDLGKKMQHAAPTMALLTAALLTAALLTMTIGAQAARHTLRWLYLLWLYLLWLYSLCR